MATPLSDYVNSWKVAINIKQEGYAVDVNYPDILYIPETAQIDMQQQCVSWYKNGELQTNKTAGKTLRISIPVASRCTWRSIRMRPAGA